MVRRSNVLYNVFVKYTTSIYHNYWNLFYLYIFINFTADSTSMSMTTSQTQMITNGICSFSPTSTKGKWIFMLQTILLSFTPIVILLAQNGTSFYYLTKEKDAILHKNNLVRQIVLYNQNGSCTNTTKFWYSWYSVVNNWLVVVRTQSLHYYR